MIGEYDYASLAGNLEAIAALPPAQWQGVVTAYGNIQRIFSIVSLCFGALAFVFFLGMRSFGLTDDEINSADEYSATDEKQSKREITASSTHESSIVELHDIQK